MNGASPDELRLAKETASRLIRMEADAVAALAERLDIEPFARAVNMLAKCSGNVATVGAGTSGIIARKVAATFTSTGTPALFIHPSDALHGGLGAIGSQEIVIAVSKSGETDEIAALLPYLASRSVPVIAIVGDVSSTLGRKASIALEARAAQEADRHGIVPTSSVAVALALADALAVTVMERNGITPDRFAANHPSGQLGRRLTLRVRDVMHSNDGRAQVVPDASFLQVVETITTGGLGAVVVLDAMEQLLGIVTDGDIRRSVQKAAVAGGLLDLRARDIMTAQPVTIGCEAMAHDALREMEERPSQIAVLPVLEENRCVGIVRLHDLAQIGL